MSYRKLIPAALLLLTVLLPANAFADDEKDVHGAVAGFYAALNELFKGEMGPMAAVWSLVRQSVFTAYMAFGIGGAIIIGVLFEAIV